MAEDDPSVFDEGHGPFSSDDEREGGVAGALTGGAAGYYVGGPGGAIAGALLGWAAGEKIDD